MRESDYPKSALLLREVYHKVRRQSNESRFDIKTEYGLGALPSKLQSLTMLTEKLRKIEKLPKEERICRMLGMVGSSRLTNLFKRGVSINPLAIAQLVRGVAGQALDSAVVLMCLENELSDYSLKQHYRRIDLLLKDRIDYWQYWNSHNEILSKIRAIESQEWVRMDLCESEMVEAMLMEGLGKMLVQHPGLMGSTRQGSLTVRDHHFLPELELLPLVKEDPTQSFQALLRGQDMQVDLRVCLSRVLAARRSVARITNQVNYIVRKVNKGDFDGLKKNVDKYE